jgi:hypothetical protein
MQLPEFMARGYNAVADRASVAADRAKERLVVVGGYSPSLSLKWLLVAILVAFGGGVFAGIKWDFSRFAQFRAEAAKLAAEKEAQNRKLQAEIDKLRADLDQAEADRQAGDREFVDVVNAPSPGQCTVPVGPINAIIKEANK